jgi:universal stress protein E
MESVMKRFRRILTGVDLAADDRLVSEQLTLPTRAAITQSIELAVESAAEICFLTVLDVSDATQQMIDEHLGGQPNIFDEAYKALNQIVQEAADAGVKATAVVCMGNSWQKIIHHVIEHKHDLVIVGSRSAGPIERVLFGSTAMKLLRYCPCPVWVTKPVPDDGLKTVLVAHDFTEIGRHALSLGASLVRLWKGELVVLHGLELLQNIGLPVPQMSQSELEIRKDAARSRIATEIATLDPTIKADVEVVIGAPEDPILRMIEERGVDLITMGTIGRTGVTGLLIGNTAERLLPQLNCSVLTVKPDDFECPVT